MPRLFRKFDPTKSQIIMSKARKGSLTNIGSVQKFENSKMYSAGSGAGSERTYLMMDPTRRFDKNPLLAKKSRAITNNDTE